MRVVYYSASSENTHRFVQKLETTTASIRLPLSNAEEIPVIREPFVLITPTYGAGKRQGAVPPQVIRFLNNETNRTNMVGVIAGGNTNYGDAYGLAADVVSNKCNRPILYRFEILGTPEDVAHVNQILKEQQL